MGQGHIVVDGAPRTATCCTLSHWPRTPTPAGLIGDTSAEIVLAALAHPDQVPRAARRCGVATIDHLDEDALISLALLCRPELADSHGDRLVAAAAVGDFGSAADDDATRVAFALRHLLDHGAVGVGTGRAGSVRATLEILPDLVARPDRHEALWRPSWDAFVAAQAAVSARGSVRIDEDEARDLAIVTVDTDIAADARGAWADRPVHPAALHRATRCTRILTVAGPGAVPHRSTIDLAFRYETWVRLARPLALPRRRRVDLGPLAAELTERDGSPWQFPGAAALVPVLARRDHRPTTVAADDVIACVRGHLDQADTGPPAWDPWA